jgi:esterase
MHLFHREIGTGQRTIILLHGLYGASDNWLGIANQLGQNFRVILPDQRNHGRSPHHPTHTYEALAADLLELIREKKLAHVILIGHSMGGKTVMRFALDHPDLVDYLVVVDICPKNYSSFTNYGEITNNHALILDALNSVDPSRLDSRSDIDNALRVHMPNDTLRRFLLKNIRHAAGGSYYWQLNLDALKQNLPEIMDGFSHLEGTHKSMVNTLFIKGEKSPYVRNEDSLVINRFFPKSQIVTIPEAGHWLHAEQPVLFVKTLLYFLSE